MPDSALVINTPAVAGVRPRHVRSVIAFLESIADAASFRPWHDGRTQPPEEMLKADARYADELITARAATGLDESAVTGTMRLRGLTVAVIALDFQFLGGTVGVAAATGLTSAVRRATAGGLPLLAVTASGGTRMQEGTLAFLQMIPLTAAIVAHRTAGLPFVVYLRNPTTGGVVASWGSLGHVTAAEPAALIGFLGPKVHAALHGERLPRRVQSAENLLAHGLLDAVVPQAGLRDYLDDVLRLLIPRKAPVAAGVAVHDAAGSAPLAPSRPWDSVTRTRARTRPGVHALLAACQPVVDLPGTGRGDPDPGLRVALANIRGIPALVVGQDRACESPIGAAGFRAARRGMRLAAELGLPVVTIVDTAGAATSRTAEEAGVASQIARCLADLMFLSTPVVSVLLGQGAGGGALALLPADRVLCARHAWLSPLPPEGASAIRHGHTRDAPRLAEAQGVSSERLVAWGAVDVVIDERPDAADEPTAFVQRTIEAVAVELIALQDQGIGDVLVGRQARHARLANMHNNACGGVLEV